MTDDADPGVAGDRGTRLDVRRPLRIGLGSLKVTALRKTDDFVFLSADFAGEEVVFARWLSLRLVQSHRIESWAVYQPASSDEPEEGSTAPDVAWRRVEWDRSADAAGFAAAPDRRAYLRGDAQLDSRIRFGRLAELPQLAAAVREGIAVMAGGVLVHAADRPDMSLQSLQVRVVDARMEMNLDYAPWSARCAEVEGWAQRWGLQIDALGEAGTVAPDGDITVTYEESLEDLLARIRRGPRPEVEPR